MKKLLAVLVLVLLGTVTFAQTWQYTAPNAYYVGGNVGIGLSNPTNDLDITDNAGIASFICNSNRPLVTGTGTLNLAQFDLKYLGNTANYWAFRNVLRYNKENSHYEMAQSIIRADGSTVAFLWVDGTNGAFEMRSGVSSATFLNTGDVNFLNGGTGRVGIGVTAPAAFKAGVKFQVNGGSYFEGRVRCHEVEVALASTFVWPDYVFNSGYKLTPLSEVETFVLANKHLPGVPSQEEISSDGVKLGEMNATLLKKVEELTLYMINIQKENDALKARVSNLEK